MLSPVAFASEPVAPLAALPIWEARPQHVTFTYRYAQPDEYHFCLESLLLAACVAQELSAMRAVVNAQADREFRALDLCAGCGVVGLELAYYHPWIRSFDFLERDEIFAPSFAQNLQTTGHSERDYRFLQGDLATWRSDGLYDLIVANPPYFSSARGPVPSRDVRRRARFFEGASGADFIACIARSLAPGGRAYFLARSGSEQGRDLGLELDATLPPPLRWRYVAQVRKSWVVRIAR